MPRTAAKGAATAAVGEPDKSGGQGGLRNFAFNCSCGHAFLARSRVGIKATCPKCGEAVTGPAGGDKVLELRQQRREKDKGRPAGRQSGPDPKAKPRSTTRSTSDSNKSRSSEPVRPRGILARLASGEWNAD